MNKTIFTVDDSRAMRDMLKMALTNAGYEVVQAEDQSVYVQLLHKAGIVLCLRFLQQLFQVTDVVVQYCRVGLEQEDREISLGHLATNFALRVRQFQVVVFPACARSAQTNKEATVKKH